MITSGLDPYTDASVLVAGKDLSGQTAIVTGGATGIGIETVKALAGAGADVVIAVRKRDLGEAAAKEVNAAVGAQRASVRHWSTYRRRPRQRRGLHPELGRQATEPYPDQQRRRQMWPVR